MSHASASRWNDPNSYTRVTEWQGDEQGQMQSSRRQSAAAAAGMLPAPSTMSTSSTFRSLRVRASNADAIAVAEAASAKQWSYFRLGLRVGVMVMLVCWVLWDCVIDSKLHPSSSSFWMDAVLPLYRASGLLILCYWCWGVCVMVWHRKRINHLYLMDLKPRLSNSHRQVFKHCITLTSFFLINFLLYFKMERGDFPKWFPNAILPMLMLVILLVIMCPWPGCGTAEKQWPSAFARVLIAPIPQVDFKHVFIGDVLTSTVKVLIDIAYGLCFLGSGLWSHADVKDDPTGRICLDSPVLKNVFNPILSALPLWLRFLQCLRRYYDTGSRFPHMVNAGKYAVAHSVVLVGVFHKSLATGSPDERAAWILTLSASTIYSYIWDIKCDWNVGQMKHKGLREHLVVASPWFYYMAIVLDLFFRFAWALTFVPAGADIPWYNHSLTPMVATMEIIRRSVWSIIRVENEQLNTMGPLNKTSSESLNIGTDGSRTSQSQQLSQPFLIPSEYEPEAEDEAQEEEEEQRGRYAGVRLLLESLVIFCIVLGVALASYFTH